MGRTGFLAGAALAAALIAAGMTTVTQAQAPELAGPGPDRCAAMASQNLIGGVSADAKWVEADPAKGLPAYCEVSGTLSPVPESKIGVVYRLPEDWNGRMLGLGGGGWAGNVTLMAATPGLKAGYATAQTDGGHPSTEVWNTEWTASPAAVTDFQYRAINRMTVAGKDLVQAYYGRPQDKAYFQGCSTGGRMALMEAQRFPDDYDAIVSGAPVYSLQVQSSAVLRNNGFAKPGAGFTPALLKLVNDAVVKACDADDGLADGIIANPRSCKWTPASLACKPGQAPGTCLSPAQVGALDTMYAGIKAPDGSWAQFPLMKGGETGWSMFINTAGGATTQANGGGMPGLAPLLYGNRKVDFSALSPDKDVPEARASAFAKGYEAIHPDLARFFARGGKLILWHGESDPGPSPVGTIDYAKAVAARAPQQAADDMRLFLLPGVGHCRGGNGPDEIDTLNAIDQWSTHGRAPEIMLATKAQSPLARPVCAFPKVARYNGSGNINEPGSYSCKE